MPAPGCTVHGHDLDVVLEHDAFGILRRQPAESVLDLGDDLVRSAAENFRFALGPSTMTMPTATESVSR